MTRNTDNYFSVDTRGDVLKGAKARRYDMLRRKVDLGEISDLQVDLHYRIAVNGHHVTVVDVDFAYTDSQGVKRAECVNFARSALHNIKKTLCKAALGIIVEDVKA